MIGSERMTATIAVALGNNSAAITSTAMNVAIQ